MCMCKSLSKTIKTSLGIYSSIPGFSVKYNSDELL